MRLRRPSAAQIADEAAEWVLRLENTNFDPTEPFPDLIDRRQRFLAWVRQSPVHLREFLELHHAYFQLDAVDPRRLVDIAALLEPPAAKIVP
jgi:ferric-dicitrate binding protein FerR (iron transport regulator)